MKSTALFIIINMIILSNPFTQHIGQWSGKDNAGDECTLILDNKGNFVFIFGAIVMGGKNSTFNGIEVEAKYKVDYSKNPITIDLMVYKKSDPKKKLILRGIIEFLNQDLLRLNLNTEPPFNRPRKFDALDAENTVVLRRVK